MYYTIIFVQPDRYEDKMVADNKRSAYEDLEDFKVDEFSLLSLHKSLVETPSVSKCELKISQLLKDYTEKAGLTVQLQMVGPGPQRYNVYADFGKIRDTKVLVICHIDTVPPLLPYHIEDTKIYGRGSCDAKGSVATQIMSYVSLFKSGNLKEGDASLLFVVDEEFSGLGMRAVSKSLNASWESGMNQPD